MLDLGGTLVRGDALLPGVPEALETLRAVKIRGDEPLIICLVSDFPLASPPTEANVAMRFGEYLARLERFGLRRFFEPVEERVTLSTHAGVFKPDRRVFETALDRLGLDAGLHECLLVTEDAEHIAAVSRLGMAALRFGDDAAADLRNWAEAAQTIARVVVPSDATDERSDTMATDETRGAGSDLDFAETAPQAGTEHETGEAAERDLFIETLRANEQLAEGPVPLPPGATHQVETDDEGCQVIRRRRFSAT